MDLISSNSVDWADLKEPKAAPAELICSDPVDLNSSNPMDSADLKEPKAAPGDFPESDNGPSTIQFDWVDCNALTDNEAKVAVEPDVNSPVIIRTSRGKVSANSGRDEILDKPLKISVEALDKGGCDRISRPDVWVM